MTEEQKTRKIHIKAGVNQYTNQPQVESNRRKRGRKKKYDPESKALNTVNHSDLSYKFNEFFKICIDKDNKIPTFGDCIKDRGNSFTLKSIFHNIDFNDEVEKKGFEARYSKAKALFIKDAENKLKSLKENKHKYSNIEDFLTDKRVIEHIKQVMNESDEMFNITKEGQYIFDLSKMSKEMEGVYATLSTDNILKDEQKINQLRNDLNVKQLELDYHTMSLNHGEIFLRKSEIRTEIEGNQLNSMLIKKTKRVIKSTETELNNIDDVHTLEQKIIIGQKQKILDMYKTGKDIAKKV